MPLYTRHKPYDFVRDFHTVRRQVAKLANNGLSLGQQITAAGADPFGQSDSAPAFNGVLSGLSPGAVVIVPTGIFRIDSPITVPAGVVLVNPDDDRSWAFPGGVYGGGGTPLPLTSQTVFQPSAAFSGSAAIILPTASPNTNQTGGQVLSGLTIDGSLLPNLNTVHGISALGYVAGVTIRECAVSGGFVTGTGGLGGDGLHTANDGTAGHNPDFWEVTHSLFGQCGGFGVNAGYLGDSYFLNVHSDNNKLGGFQVTNGSGSRYVTCRAFRSNALTTTPGWSLIGDATFIPPNYLQLIGCASDTVGVGYAFSGAGTGQYLLSGCEESGNSSGISYSGSNAYWLNDRRSITLSANAAQCTSATQVSTGLSLPVTPGTYEFEAIIIAVAQTTTAQLMYLTMAGPATSSFLAQIKYEQQFSGTANRQEHITQTQTTIGTNTGLSSNAMTSGDILWTYIQGTVTCTAAGTLTVNQATNTAGPAFTVQQGSKLKVYRQL